MNAQQPDRTDPYDDLTVLLYNDPVAVRMGRSANGYVILSKTEQQAVFVDAGVEDLLPYVQEIIDTGYEPVGLILTHFHAVGNGDVSAHRTFESDLDTPVFLHPDDASNPRVRNAGIDFRDPTTTDRFDSLDIDVRHFPGHTWGSVILSWERHGGVVFTGDSAVGSTFDETEQGIEHLTRPPLNFNVDDDLLRQQWIDLNLDLTGIAPYHGTRYLDRRTDLSELTEPLRSAAPTASYTE